MMLLALAAAAAVASPTVVDAERAFAAAAQRDGQWTAFRATAASDAVMFVPGMVNAQAWLKGRADPKEAIRWWPVSALVSCDGTLAVSTGGWTNQGGKAHGVFTTVWRKGADGWKWVLDQGHDTPQVVAEPKEAVVKTASCNAIARAANEMDFIFPASDVVIQLDNAMPGSTAEEFDKRSASIRDMPDGQTPHRLGRSADGTLRWWAASNGTKGAHGLGVYRWSGDYFEVVRLEFSTP